MAPKKRKREHDAAHRPETEGVKHEDAISPHSSSSISTEVQDEVEVEIEDGKLPNLTRSMADILNDIESPAPSKPDLTVALEGDDILLKKAVASVKKNFTETKVVSELKKMYDLYQQSQLQNVVLSGKIQKFGEKIEKYEARHRRDPRVMSALRMAERHRQERQDIFEEKKEIEGELMEAQLSTRHVEDTLKVKLREMTKFQDEIKKLREIEKHAETCETQLIKRENELQTFQEKCNGEIDAVRERAKHELNAAIAKLAEEKEAKAVVPEQETAAQKFDQSLKLSLIREIEAKQRQVNVIDKDRKMNKLLLDTSRTKGRQLMRKIRQLTLANTKMRRERRAAETELNSWKLKFATVKNELNATIEELEIAQAQVYNLRTNVRHLAGTNATLNRNWQELNANFATTSSNLKQCMATSSKLDREVNKKDIELETTAQNLDIKQNQYEYLHHRFNNLQRQKKEQGDLLRASQANTLVLIKEVTNLQQDIQKQERLNQELKESRNRLRAKLCLLKNQYVETLDKNRLLTRQKEMQEFFANDMEQRMIETETQMHSVVRANIQLYCENTTQEEIAVLQSNQFKIKEKETLALDALNQDKDDIIGRLEEKDRKKTMQIEQLSRELLDRNATLAEYKTLVKTMREEQENMQLALVKAETSEKRNSNALEMLRRQRDLFGSRLLQARTELGLVQKQATVSEAVMQCSEAAHRNLQNDLRVLKLEIKNMRRKLKIYEGNDVILESLRHDMASLTVALELEKAKCRALAESRQPIIHRWRALLAADPSKYELIIKVQKLTQRLIDKTTEVVDKELLIQQKDRHFLQLQMVLARRTTPSMSAEMNSAKALITSQQKQIKALRGELNMSMHDLSQQNQVVQRRKAETEEAKKETVKQQRMNRMLLGRKLPPIRPQTTREKILGGGFYMH